MSGPASKEEALLGHLKELAEKLGIKVRREGLNAEEATAGGGLCRLKGEYLLIVDASAPAADQIRLMVRAIKQFPLGDVYIRPAVRELLEGEREDPAGGES